MNELQRQAIEVRRVRMEFKRSENATSVTVSAVNTVPVQDNRYRILVTLIRSDRPRYWNFLCHNCGSKIVELQNLEVYTLDDFYDPQNINNAAVGRHCTGQQKQCPYTYFFKVL